MTFSQYARQMSLVTPLAWSYIAAHRLSIAATTVDATPVSDTQRSGMLALAKATGLPSWAELLETALAAHITSAVLPAQHHNIGFAIAELIDHASATCNVFDPPPPPQYAIRGGGVANKSVSLLTRLVGSLDMDDTAASDRLVRELLGRFEHNEALATRWQSWRAELLANNGGAAAASQHGHIVEQIDDVYPMTDEERSQLQHNAQEQEKQRLALIKHDAQLTRRRERDQLRRAQKRKALRELNETTKANASEATAEVEAAAAKTAWRNCCRRFRLRCTRPGQDCARSVTFSNAIAIVWPDASTATLYPTSSARRCTRRRATTSLRRAR